MLLYSLCCTLLPQTTLNQRRYGDMSTEERKLLVIESVPRSDDIILDWYVRIVIDRVHNHTELAKVIRRAVI